MEAFATVEDLQARYRPLDADERARAGALLDDASAFLASEHRRLGLDIDPADELRAGMLKVVCCAMAKRVLASGVDGDLTSCSMTAGSYTEQRTFANPAGNMYLTREERRVLGLPLKRQRIACVPPDLGEGR